MRFGVITHLDTQEAILNTFLQNSESEDVISCFATLKPMDRTEYHGIPVIPVGEMRDVDAVLIAFYTPERVGKALELLREVPDKKQKKYYLMTPQALASNADFLIGGAIDEKTVKDLRYSEQGFCVCVDPAEFIKNEGEQLSAAERFREIWREKERLGIENARLWEQLDAYFCGKIPPPHTHTTAKKAKELP